MLVIRRLRAQLALEGPPVALLCSTVAVHDLRALEPELELVLGGLTDLGEVRVVRQTQGGFGPRGVEQQVLPGGALEEAEAKGSDLATCPYRIHGGVYSLPSPTGVLFSVPLLAVQVSSSEAEPLPVLRLEPVH